MDMGTALVTAAAIGAYYQLRSQRIRAGLDDGPLFGRRRHRRAEPVGDVHGSPRETELEKEVDALRERVKVLERIATDGRPTRALADEIESLRDK